MAQRSTEGVDCLQKLVNQRRRQQRDRRDDADAIEVLTRLSSSQQRAADIT
jgi:hypothetical protein